MQNYKLQNIILETVMQARYKRDIKVKNLLVYFSYQFLVKFLCQKKKKSLNLQTIL